MTPAQRALQRGFATLAEQAPGGAITFRGAVVAAVVEYAPQDASSSAAPNFNTRQATRIRIKRCLEPKVGEHFVDCQEKIHRIRSIRASGEWLDCECEVSA